MVKDNWLETDEACTDDPCSMTISLSGTSNISTVQFLGQVITTCAGGQDPNTTEWLFSITQGTTVHTLGPVNQGNTGSNGSWAITGTTLNVDWSNFFQPKFSQQNDLASPIVIEATLRAKDKCGCGMSVNASSGMQDEATPVPASSIIIRWANDNSAATVNGTAPDMATNVNSGRVGLLGQVRQASNLAATGPTAGCSFVLQINDTISGKELNTFTFDYSSAAIDFTSATPTAATNPVFTRADNTTFTLTWAIFQQSLLAATLNASGAFSMLIDKLKLTTENSINGCFSTSTGNSIEMQMVGRMSCTGQQLSATTTAKNPRVQVDAFLAQPFYIALERTQPELLFTDSGSTSNLQQVRGIIEAERCIDTKIEVKTFTNANAVGNYNGIVTDTTRQNDGRDVMYFVSGGISATSSGSLMELKWNNTTKKWEPTILLTNNAIGILDSLDTTRVEGGRPTLLGQTPGILNFMYYTGTGNTYGITQISSPRLATNLGARTPVVDPVTGFVYMFAESGAAGNQSFHRVQSSGDPKVATNWTGQNMGALNRFVDQDGVLGAAGTGCYCISLCYTGNRVNGQPEFLFTDPIYQKIRVLRGTSGGTGAAGEWEIATLIGNGTAASTDGVGAAARVNFPYQIIHAGGQIYYFVERNGNYVRKYDRNTNTVSTLHTRTAITSTRDHLYY